MQQFDGFRAAELFCTKCNALRQVRERLLLVLPGGELYDYRCTQCGTSLGQREVKAGPMSVDSAREASRHAASARVAAAGKAMRMRRPTPR